MSRDGFYKSFWVTPEVPTPQMKADLPKDHALADARLKLKSRLKLLDVAREGDLVNAIDSCRLYCQQLRPEEDIPFVFELPMVLFTRAVLLLNRAKCVSRVRDRDKISQGAAFCLEAAGIFDHILELMNAHLMDGVEAPSSMPDLSLDVLQSLQGVCLAITQQLSIVMAVLHFDRPYSKSVLVKLHGGCQASFQLFEATLVRNCALSSSSGTMNSTAPRRDAKTLLSFASFFGRLHKAQVFLLSAELEYEAHRIGPAIVYAKIAKTLFQDRTSIGGLGLPQLTDSVAMERTLGPLLITKRAAADQLHADYTKENNSIYFETVPDHDAILLSTTLPQAFIMKPQAFHLDEKICEENGEESITTNTEQQEEQQPRHPQMTTNGVERIQVIDERDEMDTTPSAPVASDEDLESGQFVCTLPSDDAVSNGPTDFASMRRGIITELSDIMFTTNASDISPTNVVAARRRSERPPSLIIAQREATNSSLRKKSADCVISMAAPRPSDAATALENFQQRLASSATATVSQPCATGSGKSPTKLNVVQPEVQVTNSSADEQMRQQLAKGKPIIRLSKDTRWKKETMHLMNDEIVFIRKKPLLFSTQKRAAWSAIQAIQLEEGSAMKDATHFILIVAIAFASYCSVASSRRIMLPPFTAAADDRAPHSSGNTRHASFQGPLEPSSEPQRHDLDQDLEASLPAFPTSSSSTTAPGSLGSSHEHELIRTKSASTLESSAAREFTMAEHQRSFFLTEIDAKAIVEHQWCLARCMVRGSFLLYGTSEFANAAAMLSQALELAMQQHNNSPDESDHKDQDGLIALLHHHIGVAFKEDSKLKWAETMQKKALRIATRAREPRIQGRALKTLGVIFMDTGDGLHLGKALDHQQEALSIAMQEKDVELEARVYANLGNIASSSSASMRP